MLRQLRALAPADRHLATSVLARFAKRGTRAAPRAGAAHAHERRRVMDTIDFDRDRAADRRVDRPGRDSRAAAARVERARRR